MAFSEDKPIVESIPFNSDGYALPILEGDPVGDTPAILSAGSDGYNYHVLATDEVGKQLVREQNQLVPFGYDYIGFTYGGPPKRLLETMTYRSGGATGSIVATVTYTYDSNNNVISMERT